MTDASNERPVVRYDFLPGSDGRSTGKHFRETMLWLALRRGERVCFDLGGHENVPESFLDEAFGRLVREHPEIRESLRERLEFVGPNAELAARVREYIDWALSAPAREEAVRKEREAILERLTVEAREWGMGYGSLL